jgi:hypothetical protein
VDDLKDIVADETYAYPPRRIAQLDCCSLAEVYNRLARGEYEAVKDGRKTLILKRSMIARRAAKLKRAVYTPPKPKTQEGRP